MGGKSEPTEAQLAEAKFEDETLDTEQQSEMADLVDGATEEPTEEAAAAEPTPEQPPKDEPATQEPAGKPDAKDKAAEATPETRDQEGAEEPPADQPPDQPEAKKPDEPAKEPESEPTFEVITGDGVKQVGVKALVTTYQQYANLQKRHLAIKPLFDMIDDFGKKGMPLDANALMPYLELGIKTAHGMAEAAPQASAQPSQPATRQPAADGRYQGPFKSQDDDDYYKEYDADLHKAMWDQYNEKADLHAKIRNFEIQAQNAPRQPAAAPQQPQGPSTVDIQKALDDRVDKWAGDHNEYFAGDTGKQRRDAFIQFLTQRYGSMKIGEMTPEFLGAAFAGFDPQYYNHWLNERAKATVQPGKLTETFSEGADTRRPSKDSFLDEQQREMADLM